jgi:hypothetical protein
VKAVIAPRAPPRQDIRRDAAQRDAEHQPDEGAEVQQPNLEGGPEDGRGLQCLREHDGGDEGVGDHDAEGERGEGDGGGHEEGEGLDDEDEEVALRLDVREGEEEGAAGPELREGFVGAACGGGGGGVFELAGGEVFCLTMSVGEEEMSSVMSRSRSMVSGGMTKQLSRLALMMTLVILKFQR